MNKHICLFLETKHCLDSLASHKVYTLVIDQCTSHAKVEEIQKDRQIDRQG